MQLTDALISLRQNTSMSYELILSINSPKIDYSVLNAFRDSQLVDKIFYNNIRVGFTKALIDGTKLLDVGSEFVILCNSDIEVKTNFYLEKLIEYFKDPTIDAVGPLSNSAGYQTVAEDQFDFIKDNQEQYSVPFLNGFFYMVRTKLLKLDPQFKHYASEDDLSMTLKKKVIALNVFIKHYGSQTYDLSERNELCSNAMRKLKFKWGKDKIYSNIAKMEEFKDSLINKILLEKLKVIG